MADTIIDPFDAPKPAAAESVSIVDPTEAPAPAAAKPLLGPRRAVPAPAEPEPPGKLPQTAGEYATAVKRGLLALPDVLVRTPLRMAEGAVRDVAGSYGALIEGGKELSKDGDFGAARKAVLGAKERADEGRPTAPTTEAGVSTVYSPSKRTVPYSPGSEAALQAMAIPMQAAQKAGGAVGQAIGGERGRLAGEMLPEAAARVAGATSLLKLPMGVATAGKQMTQKRSALADMQADGFMVEPVQAAPGLTNYMTETVGGREGIRAKLSAENNKKAAAYIREDLGLTPDAYLKESTFAPLEAQAGKAYDAIRKLPAFNIPAKDPTFVAAIRALDKSFESIKEFVPGLVDSRRISRIQGDLLNPKSPAHVDSWTPKALLEVSQALRQEASAVLDTARSNSAAYKNASAMKTAATALEDLLDRALQPPPGVQRVGTNFAQGTLVADMRAARTLLAKINDVKAVTNLVTGEVDPIKLAGMRKAGHPLSGGLDKIGHAAEASPEVMMPPSERSARSTNLTHASDLGMGALAAGLAATTNPAFAAGIAARPITRSIVTSKPYQRAMGQARQGPGTGFNMREAAKATIAQQQAAQAEEPMQ